MEIIVGILALEYHLITTPMFVAIVFGGVVSSVILGPWLKYSIKKRKKISILEFFSEREVVPQLKTVTRDDIINELCAVASEQGNMPNAESLYRAALARENSLGTAIEEGIAFPHARIPLLVKPVIVFGRSIQGVDWNSPDGNPAHFIFLILTPKEDDEIQIKILRILATAMSNSAMRQDITKAADRSELWNV